MSDTAIAVSRIPETIILLLGIPRKSCHVYGISGCGMQLDDSGEIDWRETTLTMSLAKRELPLFLTVRGFAFNYIPKIGGYVRLDIPTVEKFISAFDGLRDFLTCFDRNKFLRLGPSAFEEPWTLTTRQARLVTLSDEEFDKLFIADPRGPLQVSEILRRVPRHTPVLRPGYEFSFPGVRGWI